LSDLAILSVVFKLKYHLFANKRKCKHKEDPKQVTGKHK
jgi:hypothetical protein